MRYGLYEYFDPFVCDGKNKVDKFILQKYWCGWKPEKIAKNVPKKFYIYTDEDEYVYILEYVNKLIDAVKSTYQMPYTQEEYDAKVAMFQRIAEERKVRDLQLKSLELNVLENSKCVDIYVISKIGGSSAYHRMSIDLSSAFGVEFYEYRRCLLPNSESHIEAMKEKYKDVKDIPIEKYLADRFFELATEVIKAEGKIWNDGECVDEAKVIINENEN